MVSILSHLGIGLLIAAVAGLNSRQIKIVAFVAILPDLDFILNALFIVLSQDMSQHTHNNLYYLMGHREFMHSFLFATLVTLYIWMREKNRKLTVVAGAAILSHVYLDYITSWKMRPFFPFITESSTIGAIYFFDPVVAIISLIPFFYIAAEYFKKNNKLRDGSRWIHAIISDEHKKLYRTLLCILIIWCILNPFAKLILIKHVENIEGNCIDYQNSYPIMPGKFLSAYPYNETHYRILVSSYWGGVEKGTFISKYPENGNEFMDYFNMSKALYDTGFPGEIDYIVYDIDVSESDVTVIISDARRHYTYYWTYFDVEYIFVFDKETQNYNSDSRRSMHNPIPLAMNFFE